MTYHSVWVLTFLLHVSGLFQEGEMPLHELLKMYGYGAADSADSEDEGPEEQNVSENGQNSIAHGDAKTNKVNTKTDPKWNI